MRNRFLSVAYAIASRNLRVAKASPAFLVPPLVAPLVFFATFVGAFSAIQRAPAFDFPSGYTSFQFVFILVQAAAFNGVFLGFAIARDFESGFARRLLLAAPYRTGMILGYVLAAVARTALSLVVLSAAGAVARLQVDGGVAEIAGLIALPLAVSAVGALWGTGVAMRLQTVQAAPLMQVPILLGLFLAPVFVPVTLLTGWIRGVASVNPITVFLETGRGYISGTEADTLLFLGVWAGLVLLGGLWALTGLRSAERGPSSGTRAELVGLRSGATT